MEKLLGKRIKRYNDIVRKDQTFLDLPLKEMMDHGCQDADFALRLHEHLDKELRKREIRDQFADTTMKLAQKLARLRVSGSSVDLKKLEKLRNAARRNRGFERAHLGSAWKEDGPGLSGRNSRRRSRTT